MPKRSRSEIWGYLCVALAAIIWGSNGVIVNRIPCSAYTIAFFRVLFASLALLPLVLLTQRSEALRAARSWKTMLSLGLLLALGWGFVFHAMKLMAIGNAVLLNYTAPIFVALLAPLLLRESLERVTLIALALSLMGIAIISSQQSLEVGNLNPRGVALALLASLSYAAFIILSKRVVATFPSLVVAFYSYSLAIIFLLPFAVGTNLSLDSTSWMLLGLLGTLNTAFAVTLYLKGLGMIKAQKAVIFTYLEPTGAVVFGFLFLSQQPTLLMLAGGSLILLAGYLVASR